MLITIEDFRSRITSDADGLVRDLQALTGRYGGNEAQAWRNSLRELSTAFSGPSFQPLHLYFGSRGNLALEYQLPAASSWCDVVLLGAHEERPAAVVIELKDWLTRSDKPGRAEGLIERQGAQELHPSEQVKGYVDYCQRFHSAVEDHGAKVHGCVLFTRDHWAPEYANEPNTSLASKFPFFTLTPSDIEDRFPSFFKERLSSPAPMFASDFATGRYRQNRGFVAQIAAQILDPQASVFELLDNQRKAFALSRAFIEDAFLNSKSGAPPKKVIIIKGPPGSGKSVIAAKLWAALVTNPKMPKGDIVFTTTSQSQNSNWAEVFKKTTKIDGAQGVIRKATTYTPITTQRLGKLRKLYGETVLEDAEQWRENLAFLRDIGEKTRDGAEDNQNLVTIVDEAHALINPEHPAGRGQFGFVTGLGPQAFHISRSSLLSVFLLDPLQGFRQRENTTIEDIRTWSKELGAGAPEEISLEDTQFRCGGSKEYVAWIESVLAGASADKNRELAAAWYHPSGIEVEATNIIPFPVFGEEETLSKVAETPPESDYHVVRRTAPQRPIGSMDFRIFADPEAWEIDLRTVHRAGHSVRLLSTYSRKWKTEGAANPHGLSPHMMDFHEPYEIGGEERFWSRIWNFVPRGTDYTWYVTGHRAGRIAHDPLCEVGCPYAVRGFDFDYVGVVWLDDLMWTTSGLMVDPEKVEERGMSRLASAARKEARKGVVGPAIDELSTRVAQAYRILLTRPLKGAYVWIPDSKTRDHLVSSLGRFANSNE